LRPEHQAAEEKGPKVPGYIVTYSDMVTLLLTFFVMLLTLAHVQDPELFDRGRGAFVRSLEEFGLGILYGMKGKLNFGHVKVKYFIRIPDISYEGRTIDEKEERVRRIFTSFSQHVRAVPSQLTAKKTNFLVTDIRFAPSVATLNEAGKRFLSKFCSDLKQDPDSRAARLYVMGLAPDEATEQRQWTLSAERAQAVAEFLRGESGPRWPIYSWGAGPGGEWVERDSPVSRKSQILIAVLRAQQ